MLLISKIALYTVVLLLVCAQAGNTLAGGDNAAVQSPKNVILIIGDGMDDHQISIARNYLVGARGRLSLDSMAHRSVVQVLTVDNAQPEKAVYVADSANSASAIASGSVTSRARIATSAGTDKDLPTLVELASAAGFRTGVVTTASVTDATPAAFYAHTNLRYCENPSMMKDALAYGRVPVDCSQDLIVNGGLGSIAEQLLSSDLDLAFGGGQKHFAMLGEGSSKSLLVQARESGFELLDSKAQLDKQYPNKKMLGLFARSTLPVVLRGQGGRGAEAAVPKQNGVSLPEAMPCENNPKFADTPSLKLMTEAALAHLSRESQAGFFLMVESASIDKQSHLRNACGSIGEVAQLNEALDSALLFAETHENTLIIVTADHGQAAQLIPSVSLYSNPDLAIYSPGKLFRIITPEGAVMAVNYATNDFVSEEHTGVNVPLFTNGVGKNILPSMLTQPDLFGVMSDYLGLDRQ